MPPSTVRAVDRATLARDLACFVFPAPGAPFPARRIGAEVELIPIDDATQRPLPLDGSSRSVLAIVRRAGLARGWCERRSAKAGVPEVHLPGSARITFEPGGQIELSSAPYASATALLAELHDVTQALGEAASALGVTLRSVGIDPATPIDEVAPQLDAARYRRMLAYFDTVGPWGARMMRQTASVQVSVDGGENPARTWRVLNAMTPCLTAIFANSPIYEGAPTGHQSFRQHVWRELDPARTGLRQCDGHPIDEYLAFALGAPAFLASDDATPFGDLVTAGRVTLDDWRVHLTTLFPEVRPRGYFEVRSPDAIDPCWYAAPLALVGGIARHEPALDAADDLLGAPDPDRLVRAGVCGLADPAIARVANDLVSLALQTCETLGDAFMAEPDRETARAFFERYTRKGRSPADDALAAAGDRRGA